MASQDYRFTFQLGHGSKEDFNFRQESGFCEKTRKWLTISLRCKEDCLWCFQYT